MAADAAEGILDWADRERRLNTRYTPARCVIETGAGPLLRLAATGWPEQIRVQLGALANHGESWDDEHIDQFVQELADIGVQLGPNRKLPRAPLEPLGDDTRRRQFLPLMERARYVDHFPVARRRTRVSRGPRNSERADTWSESSSDAHGLIRSPTLERELRRADRTARLRRDSAVHVWTRSANLSIRGDHLGEAA